MVNLNMIIDLPNQMFPVLFAVSIFALEEASFSILLKEELFKVQEVLS